MYEIYIFMYIYIYIIHLTLKGLKGLKGLGFELKLKLIFLQFGNFECRFMNF